MASGPGIDLNASQASSHVMHGILDGSATPCLKRPLSATHDDDDLNTRKKLKGDMDMDRSNSGKNGEEIPTAVNGDALAEDLAQELMCPCCSDLVYKPVVILPCDHISCGSCLTLWIRNGGTACPACRSISTAVMPSRAIQTMVNVLLRAAPHMQRSERERMQADEVYPVLRTFRIPTPREPSPELAIPATTEFYTPCPTCTSGNPHNWTCPQPIPNPIANPANALRKEDGIPRGHGLCGNCESLLALTAPLTSRCDFCQVSFCGINVPDRCSALGISSQSPQGFSDIGDLVQSGDVYEVLDGNMIEVEALIDHMTAHRISPKHIFRQIAAYMQSQPDGFFPLFEEGIFTDIHTAPAGVDPDPTAPRRNICRVCATEVFLSGLREWWFRERRKAIKEGTIVAKPDCVFGKECIILNDPSHAREYNHLIVLTEPKVSPPSSSAATSSSDARIPPETESDISRSPYISLSALPRLADLDSPLPRMPSTPIPTYLATSDLNVTPSWSSFLHADIGGSSESRSQSNGALSGRIASLLNPAEPSFRPESDANSTQSFSDCDRDRDGTLDFSCREPHSDQSQESIETMLGQFSEGAALNMDKKGKAPIRRLTFNSLLDDETDVEPERNFVASSNTLSQARPFATASSGSGHKAVDNLNRARSPLKTIDMEEQRQRPGNSRSPHLTHPHLQPPSNLALHFLSPMMGSSVSGGSSDTMLNTQALQVE